MSHKKHGMQRKLDSEIRTRYPSDKKRKLEKIAEREYKSLSRVAQDSLDDHIRNYEATRGVEL